jgi:hypothetical protein
MRTKQNSAKARIFMNCPSNAVEKNAKSHAQSQKPDRPLNSFKIQSPAKYTIY